MKWQLRGAVDTLAEIHESRESALGHLERMGPAFSSWYKPVPITNDPQEYRMLTEGLIAGDLRYIILPQISVDEYLPGDSKSDNIVIAFFIKGVPNAVVPFRDFMMKCVGVIDVAYSDSDTLPDTSLVYVEMSRKVKMEHIKEIMEQVTLLTLLDVEDFTVIFPTSTKRHPYSLEILDEYFTRRSNRQNWKAQQMALNDREEETDEDVVIESLMDRM